MKEYKITGIRTKRYGEFIRFTGFFLEGIAGDVDPFVDGVLEIPNILETCNQDGIPYSPEKFIDAEMKWAKEQIGKTMICKLSYQAFATDGGVKFKE